MEENDDRPNPKLSRRSLLLGAGAVVATGVAAKLGIDRFSAPKAPVAEGKQIDPSVFKQAGETDIWFGFNNANSSFLVIKDGMPNRGRFNKLQDSEKAVYFDPEEVRLAREKALSSKEPQIVAVIPIKYEREASGYRQYNQGRRPVKDLPKDTLSAEELAEHGVTIYQTEFNKYYIRQGAFEPGGKLQSFRKDGRKLNIILVDGTVVDQRNITDPKLADLKKFAPKELDVVEIRAFRQKLVAQAEQNLQLALQNSTPKEIDVLKLKETIYKLSHIYSDEDLLTYGSNFLLRGWHIFDQASNTTQIFLANGKKPEQGLVTIYFDREGKLQTLTSEDSVLGYSPHPRYFDSHPGSPDSIPLQPRGSNSSYSVDQLPAPAGFTLRHELGHEQEKDEKLVDQAVIKELSTDWKIWYDSGYGKKDINGDKAYNFVFSLRPEDGGGYIIT